MSFKVSVAFFVTLLAIQATTQTPLEDSSTKSEIATILEDVLQLTAELLKLVTKVVSDLKADEDAITDKIVNFAVKIANQVNHLIVKLIDELKDGATTDGKAVLSCIEAEETKTDAAIEKFAKDTGSCLAKELKPIFDEVDVILNQLESLQTDVKKQVDKLRDCKGLDTVCLLEFAQNAVVVVKKIPPVAKQDIADIVKLVETILSDVSACKLGDEIKSSAQEIFNDAVVCIKK